ncbi:unnamed protein product [Trichogramma brassicae]|uniref:Uncharacterized protein n=1 Tax=Trichogramma brassicae TaxID=86971 RepID=A0A6H5I0Y6_9HYME|nr:unnamed protein product [Trichogramma brassicae]
MCVGDSPVYKSRLPPLPLCSSCTANATNSCVCTTNGRTALKSRNSWPGRSRGPSRTTGIDGASRGSRSWRRRRRRRVSSTKPPASPPPPLPPPPAAATPRSRRAAASGGRRRVSKSGRVVAVISARGERSSSAASRTATGSLGRGSGRVDVGHGARTTTTARRKGYRSAPSGSCFFVRGEAAHRRWRRGVVEMRQREEIRSSSQWIYRFENKVVKISCSASINNIDYHEYIFDIELQLLSPSRNNPVHNTTSFHT